MTNVTWTTRFTVSATTRVVLFLPSTYPSYSLGPALPETSPSSSVFRLICRSVRPV